MKLSRNDSRVLAMAILYQVDLFEKKNIPYDLEDIIMKNTVGVSDDISFVRELVKGVIAHHDQLVEMANLYLKDWNLSRLGITDGAILKIAIYELCYTDTPSKVCIDEAIELAKCFSDEPVVGMINGVLDRVYHEKVQGEK